MPGLLMDTGYQVVEEAMKEIDKEEIWKFKDLNTDFLSSIMMLQLKKTEEINRLNIEFLNLKLHLLCQSKEKLSDFCAKSEKILQ